MVKTKKIALIGCNSIGLNFIAAAINQNLAAEYFLFDENVALKEASIMDLEDCIASLNTPVKICLGTETDFANMDYVVITTRRLQQTDETIATMIEHNVQNMQKIAQQLKAYNFQGVILIASQPVDVLTYALIKASHLPAKQIIGTGTCLDTKRLQTLISNELKIAANAVNGFVLGEHGNNTFVAFSSIMLHNLNITKFNKSRFTDTSYEHELEIPISKKAYEMISRKHEPCYGIAYVLVDLLKTLIFDSKKMFTVSTLLNGEYGYKDVVISVPCILGINGVEQIIDIGLNSKEKNKLQTAYESIESNLEKIKEVV